MCLEWTREEDRKMNQDNDQSAATMGKCQHRMRLSATRCVQVRWRGYLFALAPQQPYSKHLVRASQQGSLVHDNEWSPDHVHGNHRLECWSQMETTVLAACRKGHEQELGLLFGAWQ